MDDLAEFLAARLNEDEAAAKAAGGDPWHGDTHSGLYHEDVRSQPGPFATGAYEVFTGGEEAHILRHDPARVLREVAAKRAILGAYESQRAAQFNDPAVVDELRDVVQTLASVHSDHPDYRPEWKP
jgi:hypothetical protein